MSPEALSTSTAVLAIALLIIGAVMLKFGFWPRRRGDEPHCRRCGYVLMGNQSGRCPECGEHSTARSIIRGARYRRAGLTVGALLILLLAVLLGIGPRVSGLNWYHHWPETWLLNELESNSEGAARRAWDELMRRHATGGLRESTVIKLVERALRERVPSHPGTLTR